MEEKKILVLGRRDHTEAMRGAAGLTIFGHAVRLVFMTGPVADTDENAAQAELLELSDIVPETTVPEMGEDLALLDAAALGAALALMAGPAFAADPLVDVAWLRKNLGADGMVVIDARGSTDYLRGHIPGAVNTNYGRDGWRVKVDGAPGLFPEDPTKLGELIGSLGVGDGTQVVIVAPGNTSSDMGIATRIYWTFKVLGHDDVSVLNGGMKAYLADADDNNKPVNPLEKGAVEATPASFTIDFREEMVPDAGEVMAMIDGGALAVDNRTADQYLGVNKHGAAKAYGTIPGAVNLPQSWATVNAGGEFRDADTLAALYDAAGVPAEGAQVNFCNTGHWASIGWFVSHEILGNEEAVLYDPSMTGWTAEDMPVEAKIAAH